MRAPTSGPPVRSRTAVSIESRRQRGPKRSRFADRSDLLAGRGSRAAGAPSRRGPIAPSAGGRAARIGLPLQLLQPGLFPDGRAAPAPPQLPTLPTSPGCQPLQYPGVGPRFRRGSPPSADGSARAGPPRSSHGGPPAPARMTHDLPFAVHGNNPDGADEADQGPQRGTVGPPRGSRAAEVTDRTSCTCGYRQAPRILVKMERVRARAREESRGSRRSSCLCGCRELT